MAVFTALRTAGTAVRRNPLLFVVAALYGVLQVPGILLRASPDVVLNVAASGYSLLTLLVAPLVVGGVLAMADEALDGRTDWGTFVAGGKATYLRILAALLLYVVAVFVVSLIFAFVTVAVAVVTGGAAVGVAFIAIGLVALALVLAAVAVLVFVQFYPQAVVVEDYGVADAFRRSAGLARRHLAAVLGYTALFLGISVVFGGVAAVASFYVIDGGTLAGATTGPPVAVLAAYVVLYVVAGGLFGGYLATYSVAFYRELLAADA